MNGDKLPQAKPLRNKLFLFLAVILLLLCAGVVSGITIPLYQSLRLELEKGFVSGANNRAEAVSQWVIRAKDLARQVTSRTRIRQELEKYNQGSVTLEALRHFTAPKLSDAIGLSEEIAGISRLDKKGELVLELGVPVPNLVGLARDNGEGQVSLGSSFKQLGRNFVWLRAPITDRQGNMVGTDYVVIHLDKLREIITCSAASSHDQPASSNSILVIKGNTLNEVIPSSICNNQLRRDDRLQAIFNLSLVNLTRVGFSHFTTDDFFCVTTRVKGSSWFLTTSLDMEKLYAPIVSELRKAVFIGIAVYILCLVAYWSMLHPLARNLLMRQEELKAEIDSKTESLREELEIRKQTEDSLRQSQDILSRAQKISNIGHWEWDITSNTLYWSDEIYRIFGLVPQEFGASYEAFLDRVHPDDVKTVKKAVALALDGKKPYGIEHRLIRSSGEVRYVAQMAEISYDDNGNPKKLLGVIQDNTERAMAKKDLIENEERLRTLINSSPDIICFKDGDGRWLEANQAIINLLGLINVEFKGKSNIELAQLVTPPKQTHLVECANSDKEAWEQQSPYLCEETFCGPEGQPLIYDTIKVPLFHSDKTRKGLVILGRDITARLRMEKEKEHLNAQLLHAHKMEAMGTMAGGVAHEFNNIIATIMGYCDLAQDNEAEGRGTGSELRQIMNAAERAKKLVLQVLSFSRKINPEMKPTDLNRVVQDSSGLMRQILPKMITLESELYQDLPLLQADATQLQSVLMNLATNARDAMPKGGIIKIKTDTIVIENKTCTGCGKAISGKFIRLVFSDTGKGMNEDTLRQVFNPFFTTKEIGKGTGLGMSVLFGIIKGHGGHIICHTKPGEGSSFELLFPYIEISQITEDKDIKQIATDPGGSEHILFADDEKPLRNLVRIMLGKAGYKTITAASGEEAIAAYQANPKAFGCVIMDLDMTGMGGREAIREFRKIDPDVKIIIASGLWAEMTESTSVLDGVRAFLSKPFNKTELLGVLRDVLDS